MDTARQSLEKGTVTAPFPGVISGRMVDPGARFRVGASGGFGVGATTPVEVKIFGADLEVLTRLSRDLARALAANPGFADVRSSP